MKASAGDFGLDSNIFPTAYRYMNKLLDGLSDSVATQIFVCLR